MSIERNNLAALQKKYPEIYNKIKDIIPRTKYQLIPVKGQNDVPNMVNSQTKMLFYDNSDPMGAAVKSMHDKQIKLPVFNIFLGTGLMYNFFAFFKVYEVKDSINIIIEKDPDIFRTLISCVDITKIIENNMFHIILDEEPKSLFTKINRIIHNTNAKFHAKSINFIEDPGSFIANKEYYLNTIKILKEALREVIMFYGNDPFDSMIGIENTFLNIEEIIQWPGIKDLKDAFKGKPGVVIASGPSLNKNIHLLDGIKDKAVLCAADGSMKILKSKGVKPHLVSSLERMTPTAKLFEELTEEDTKDVYLAATPVIHPLTYKNYPGERIITYRNFATFKWLGIEKGILDIGPSAGNMAFKTLEYLGCDPIILIGQDLAFGEGEVTHADGYTYGQKHEAEAFAEKNYRYVEGNYQPQIKTSRVWQMFLQYYHKDASASPARVINATEGGAKILGTEIMTFQEAIDQCIKEDISVLDTIKAKLQKPDDNEIKANREHTLNVVNNGLAYCHIAEQTFKEAIEQCDSFLQNVYFPFKADNNYDQQKASPYLTKLEQLSEIFKDQNFYEVLMHYVQSYFIRTMIEINAAKHSAPNLGESESRNVLLLKDMYKVMSGLNNKMIQLMEILKNRLEEKMD